VWPYSPAMLPLAFLLAQLPYVAALFVWLVPALLVLYLLMRSLLRSDLALIALALAPAVIINFASGQNAFIVAAILVGGFLLLDEHPLAAGICFAALLIKPHLGLLVPIVLLVTTQWRALAGGAVTGALILLASLLIYGPQAWYDWRALITGPVSELMASGRLDHFLQSIFSALRLGGFSNSQAAMGQTILSVVLACLIALIWRSQASRRLKIAVVLIAAPLVTPYAFLYDYALVACGVALAMDEALRATSVAIRLAWLATLLAAWFAPMMAFAVEHFDFGPWASLSALLALLVTAWVALRASPLPEANRARRNEQPPIMGQQTP
jgi:Glycosyltransferase family 87